MDFLPTQRIGRFSGMIEEESDSSDGEEAAEDPSVAQSTPMAGGSRLPPERLWARVPEDFRGEVDPDAFAASAGEVLDALLADTMDDVVGGRFNWMRPMPRTKR